MDEYSGWGCTRREIPSCRVVPGMNGDAPGDGGSGCGCNKREIPSRRVAPGMKIQALEDKILIVALCKIGTHLWPSDFLALKVCQLKHCWWQNPHNFVCPQLLLFKHFTKLRKDS